MHRVLIGEREHDTTVPLEGECLTYACKGNSKPLYNGNVKIKAEYHAMHKLYDM